MVCPTCGEYLVEAETVEGRKIKLEVNTPTYLVLEEIDGKVKVKKIDSSYPQHIHKGS